MAFKTNGSKWHSGQCNVNINGPAWDTSWKAAARAAMNAWNSVGAKFKFKEDPASTTHLAAYNLHPGNAWIAVTQVKPKGSKKSLTQCNILVNLHYEFDPSHPSGSTAGGHPPYDLETVLTHELGHMLWLADDTSGATTMMKGLIKRGETRTLHADDKKGIKSLYP